MVKVLFIPTAHSSIAYIIDCLVAPSIGVIVGGVIIKCLGGYENLNASYLVVVGGISACLLTIPIPFVNSFYGYNGLLFGVLIFGGMAAPAIIGIILHSVPLHQRAIASSIMLIFCNLLGYIPAPFIYGMIYDYTSTDNPKLANGVCMYFSIFGAVFIVLSAFARKNEFDRLSNRKSLDQKAHPSKSLYVSSIDLNINRPSLREFTQKAEILLVEENRKGTLDDNISDIKSSSNDSNKFEL